MTGYGTSDGIRAADWNRVQSLAAMIAAHVCSGEHCDARLETQNLLRELKRLQKDYGPLPSILATRADYVRGMSRRISLLERAWRNAQRLKDRPNLVYISSSLAEAFVEELRSKANGEKWLERLEDALGDYWDDAEYGLLGELRAKLKGIPT